jgi:hypothetical protein
VNRPLLKVENEAVLFVEENLPCEEEENETEAEVDLILEVNELVEL